MRNTVIPDREAGSNNWSTTSVQLYHCRAAWKDGRRFPGWQQFLLRDSLQAILSIRHHFETLKLVIDRPDVRPAKCDGAFHLFCKVWIGQVALQWTGMRQYILAGSSHRTFCCTSLVSSLQLRRMRWVLVPMHSLSVVAPNPMANVQRTDTAPLLDCIRQVLGLWSNSIWRWLILFALLLNWFIAMSWKVKSVFSLISLTEGLRPRLGTAEIHPPPGCPDQCYSTESAAAILASSSPESVAASPAARAELFDRGIVLGDCHILRRTACFVMCRSHNNFSSRPQMSIGWSWMLSMSDKYSCCSTMTFLEITIKNIHQHAIEPLALSPSSGDNITSYDS